MFMLFLFSVLGLIRILCFCVIVTCWLGSMLTISLLSFGGKFWLLSLEFDLVRVLILLMLIICFIYVHYYTGHYFVGRIAGIELNKIICLFVGVMASLVCTGDFLLTLVFWEYLGVVRFFLILFYDSYLSLRSSIVTLVSSRFGDVCLFILICIRCYIIGSPRCAILVFFFIILSKSAGFPFIRWLLEAMRAPTPVRSLVHSSTLVAAGVWFAMRYDMMLWFNDGFVFSLALLLTIFITGLCCFFFIDLKKIVALSTCNKISWCIFYLMFGDFILSLFQLVSHGVSKCMLFMLVGDVMRGTSGSQIRNCVYSPYLYGKWGVFSLFSVVLGLSGAPFIGVFFTKHFLLTNFMNVSKVLLYIFVLSCIFLSYFYSFRLCSILVNLKLRVFTGSLYFFKSGMMVYFWLFVNYFISVTLDETVTLRFMASADLLLFQLISCASAYYFYRGLIFSKWRSSLFGCDKVVEFLYHVFYCLTVATSVFFYRWDRHMLSLFSGLGGRSISVYTIKFLNIIVVTIFLFLTCYVIIYK